jgi:hypothetical protein
MRHLSVASGESVAVVKGGTNPPIVISHHALGLSKEARRALGARKTLSTKPSRTPFRRTIRFQSRAADDERARLSFLTLSFKERDTTARRLSRFNKRDSSLTASQ